MILNETQKICPQKYFLPVRDGLGGIRTMAVGQKINAKALGKIGVMGISALAGSWIPRNGMTFSLFASSRPCAFALGFEMHHYVLRGSELSLRILPGFLPVI